MPTLTPRPNFTFPIWLGYLLFVVYGSLVPLDFKPLALDQAWALFQHTPMLELGVQSRADWIANGVLYVPVGFLTAHLLMEKLPGTPRTLLYFLVGVFSFALTIGVEFTQLFFPPRTVSLNDILAECLGSLIGILVAAKCSGWFKTLLHTLFSDPRRFARRLVESYLFGYVAFSLFPYDILLSGAELAEKLRGNNWGWLLAGEAQGTSLTVLKLLAEIILVLPFGLFLGYRSGSRTATFKQATLLGILLGGFIEIAQFFIYSGVSQGLSVLTRTLGFCGGLALWQRRANWSPERLALTVQRYAFLLGTVYLFALLEVNGWFSHRWGGMDFALSQLEELHFLPFYYHYYTTEAKALYSLASVCFMYLPIGLLVWSNRGSPSRAFFYALFGASLVETGKLFLLDTHPDPTNILLGALASWGGVHLARALAKAASMPSSSSAPHPSDTTKQSEKRIPITREPARRWTSVTLLLPSLAFAAYWAATFPTQPVLLCLFLAACAAIIWRRPILLVAIIPAALPILDLAPWSGRFYLDEFDLLVLLSFAIGYTQVSPVPREKRHADTLFAVATCLLALSFAVSALRGLTPWQMPDANAFTNYLSPFNTLRIGKGALWAFLSYGLLRRFVVSGIDIKRPFALGIVAGLALTVGVILWERLTFVSLFDFASDYRVTGPFSAMHTGGAYIECFLVIATPFLLVFILQTGNWLSRLLGIGLLFASTYALMVTFSRNGYAAFGLALAIILFFATFKSGRWQHRSILVASLTLAILAIAIPVFNGRFAQDRLANVAKDYAVRQAHWQDALNIRSPDWVTTLFGMGLGRYPQSHYLFSREGSRTATYQLVNENGNAILRLGSGDPVYIEQIVSIQPRQNYVLKLDARSSMPDGEITAALCEKWMLTSFKCVEAPISAGDADGAWQSLTAPLLSGSLAEGPWYSRKPVKFILHSSADRSTVDIKNVRLETSRGENLLRNGSFSKGLDHWYFSADNHLQWHAKNLPIAVLFDQGWLGLIALCTFSVLVIKRAAGRAWQGDLHAAAALAAFCGFLIVGLFDTLLDAPRFLFLFLLLGGFCGFRNLSILPEKPGQSSRFDISVE
ncbi:MAG: hypothetical protein H6R07_3245 [Proteobacteria bacterium]|nr:hypothetical protein [Pseudomonadota bacterium]